MTRRHSTGWAVTLTLTAAAATAEAEVGGERNAKPHATSTLSEMVEAFFRADHAERRDALMAEIENVSGGSIEIVAKAVRRVQLWPKIPEIHGVFSFKSAAAGTVQTAYQLPPGYDPKHRYPTVLCMSDESTSAPASLASAGAVLGDALDEFVLIAPKRRLSGWFHKNSSAAVDLPALMREVRRRFHIDTDRVFLFGVEAGGDAAWLAAIMHSDLFAGVIVFSAYPRVPYPAQAYPFLLENLRQLAVLTVWTGAGDTQATNRQEAVGAHNRAIAALSKTALLPIASVELPSDTLPALKPPDAQLVNILSRRRVTHAHSVAHWFRYPAQGHARWLTQTKFMGDVWEAEQISILASSSADRDEFIADVLKQKLAYLGGRIDGQTITIKTRACARIKLLLPEGIVNLAKPLTVSCNGIKRFEGIAHPSIRTLLEDSYARWEFQRPAVVELSFSIRADSRSPP